MEQEDHTLAPADYSQSMASFIRTHNERDLYRATALSRACIEGGLGPEDIVALHFEALEKILPTFPYREHARIISDAHQFLLEVMIAYGVHYKEYLELKFNDTVRSAEARASREQERALELERLEREKSEILAVISHELRNPITVARGNVELAERALEDDNPAKRYLLPAREALDRLSRLSGDLVEASRGEPAPLALAPLRLRTVVTQACNWARPAAENKGLAFACGEIPHDIAVQGNPDALLSVLGNLLSNAIRYTGAGGAITVEVGGDESTAWVDVVDSGIGMPPEVQARIFEKFYRGPEARRLETKGLGLGLALVYQLVQAHEGEVDVVSDPGRGSRFRVSLPRPTPADTVPTARGTTDA